MNQKIDFFKKGFNFNGETRPLYCDVCRNITPHRIELLCDCPKDNVVHALIACEYCLDGHKKLEALGVNSKHPVKYQRFFVQPYIFLVMHPNYLNP